ESNRRKVQEGTLAPIDIVAADTQVTNFEQNVYTAQEQVTRAEATLKTLLLPDENAPLWSRALVPTTPVTSEAPRAGFTDALTAAYANRPELQQLQTSREINEIDARYFRDQTKPQIDLVASATSSGLAGSLVQSSGANPLTSSFGPFIDRLNVLSTGAGLPPVEFPTTTGSGIPNNLVGGYGQSLQNLAGFNYPTYQVGVRIDLPLGNRTAKANLGRSLAEGTRIATQRNQTEQQIKLEVQTSLQALRSAEARLASAAASRASSEQLYESEKRRYENGTSTLFVVLQRQQELVVARSNELQSQTELNKSIANFQRATGNTFEANNVDIGTESSRNLRMTTPVGDDFTPAAIRSSLQRRAKTDEKKTEISSLNERP
ncbi:MAG TPA: TolC family protein, partial [Pyrinomonadaceae bacterium]